MSRSLRSYQREIAHLKATIRDMQWVQPTYNGNSSCSGCTNPKHWGCEKDCPAALITKDFGSPEKTEMDQ